MLNLCVIQACPCIIVEDDRNRQTRANPVHIPAIKYAGGLDLRAGPVHGRVLLVMVRCLLVGVANAEQGMLVQGARTQVPAHGQAGLGEACRYGNGGSAGHAERSSPAAAGHDRRTGVLTALDGRLGNDWARWALARGRRRGCRICRRRRASFGPSAPAPWEPASADRRG